MAAKHNLDADQGAYWAQQLVWKDGNGDPIDLSGYEARMMIRPVIEGPKKVAVLASIGETGATGPTGVAVGLITLAGAYGMTGPTGPTGAISLEIEADQTDLMPEGRHYYDLELVPPDGRVKRLLQGRFQVFPEVTR